MEGCEGEKAYLRSAENSGDTNRFTNCTRTVSASLIGNRSNGDGASAAAPRPDRCSKAKLSNPAAASMPPSFVGRRRGLLDSMSMTLRHAAALALVGWHLMVPPLSTAPFGSKLADDEAFRCPDGLTGFSLM